MPIYEYVCVSCEHKFDKLQSMTSCGASYPRCSQRSGQSHCSPRLRLATKARWARWPVWAAAARALGPAAPAP